MVAMETRLVEMAPKTPHFKEMKSGNAQFWPVFCGGYVMEGV